MAKFNNLIKKIENNEVRNIMTHLKETPVAQIFEVGIYKFLIQFAIGIALLVGGYYIIVDRIDDNETDIGINAVFGTETRNIANAHIEGTKGEPLSEQALTYKVGNIEDDVADHEIKINEHETAIIKLDKSEAVQQIQNKNIIEKLEDISEKLDNQ